MAAGVGAAALIAGDLNIATQAAIGGLVAFAVFWVPHRVRPGGFGWGDGKYIPIIGAAIASVSLAVAWWAFLIACVAAVLATPFRRRRSAFPFGPWLAGGALVTLILLR